jgi:pantetheine-phosphate adenylyltransferase
MSKQAIYAGTFDPFTLGHMHILKQACSIFDMVHVVFANNPTKIRTYDCDDMCLALRLDIETTDLNKKVGIWQTNGLIADWALKNGINFSVRGLRNSMDYGYEENIAKINKEINPELNTIYLRTNDEIISSSMVKELYKHGKDISKYVGRNVLEVILDA